MTLLTSTKTARASHRTTSIQNTSQRRACLSQIQTLKLGHQGLAPLLQQEAQRLHLPGHDRENTTEVDRQSRGGGRREGETRMGPPPDPRTPLEKVLLDLPTGFSSLPGARPALVDASRRCSRWRWDHKLPHGLRGLPHSCRHVQRTLVLTNTEVVTTFT